MSKASLGDRAKALEESFFHEKNKQLLDILRKELETKDKRAALTAASGITDVHVLDRLLASGIESETLAAMSLVPLVVVSWADGKVQDEERQAIMSAAAESGVDDASPCRPLLEGWLKQAPPAELLAAWKDYTRALLATLDQESVVALKQVVVGRAKNVAAAAGGFLGLGKVSSSERAVMQDLESVFAE